MKPSSARRIAAPVPGILRVELRDPADLGAAGDRLEVDVAAVVLDGQARGVRVGAAAVRYKLGDRVAPRDAPRAQDAHGADALRRALARALELDGVDRRPLGPRRAVPQKGVD